jgi:NADH:ubiquinone oxidoreductase subunit D
VLALRGEKVFSEMSEIGILHRGGEGAEKARFGLVEDKNVKLKLHLLVMPQHWTLHYLCDKMNQ